MLEELEKRIREYHKLSAPSCFHWKSFSLLSIDTALESAIRDGYILTGISPKEKWIVSIEWADNTHTEDRYYVPLSYIIELGHTK